METTRLSSKGQIIIPKRIREAQHWKAGQEFILEQTGEGLLIRPVPSFQRTTLEDVGQALNYTGPVVPVEELNVEALGYQDPYAEDEGD